MSENVEVGWILERGPTMTWPVPTTEDQVSFLRSIQRLLSEGLFVASCKFALFHALADLAELKSDEESFATSQSSLVAVFVGLKRSQFLVEKIETKVKVYVMRSE